MESDFELDQVGPSNKDLLESESSTIQFVSPNHLSLQEIEMLLYGIRRFVDRSLVKRMIAWQMVFIVWASLIKHIFIKVINIRLYYGEHMIDMNISFLGYIDSCHQILVRLDSTLKHSVHFVSYQSIFDKVL